MDEITRRGFVGAVGSMGAMGAMGAVMGMAPREAEASNWRDVDKFVGTEGVRGSANPTATGPENPVMTREEAIRWLHDQPMVTEPYTCPDGTVIPAAYINVRNRWNRVGLGYGSEIGDGSHYWDWWMINFSEDEADFYCHLPVLKRFDAAEASMTTGRPEVTCGVLCETLASRGMLLRYVYAGVPYYLTPALPSAQVVRYDDPGYYEAWINAYTPDVMQGAIDSGTKTYQTMPVGREVVANTEVLPYDDWKGILERHEYFVIDSCACKAGDSTAAGDLSFMHDPDARMADGHNDRINICLALGELAECYIHMGVGRQVTREEAYRSVEQSIEEGLILQHFNDKRTEVLCQCRCDHCAIMGPQRALDGQGDAVFCQSNYILELDKDTCIQCGACIERCPMNSITFGDDGFPQMDAACAVCGQCAYICPAEARVLKLKPVEQQIDLPDSVLEDWTEKAIYRVMKGTCYDFLPGLE